MSSYSNPRKRAAVSMLADAVLKKYRVAKQPGAKKFQMSRSNKSFVNKGVVTGGPLGPERKKFDNSQASTGVNTALSTTVSLLAGIAEGTNVTQRIGQRIHVKAVDLNLQVVAGTASATAGGLPEFADFLIVWDKQPNEATATTTQIFEAAGTTNLTFLNTQNLERFQVLKRIRVHFDSASAQSFCTEMHIPCELAVRYSDATTTPNTNDLVFAAISNSENVAANFPSFQFNWRVSFTDE